MRFSYRTGFVMVAPLVLAAVFAVQAANQDPTFKGSDFTLAQERFRGLVQPAKQVVLNAPLAGILRELLVEEGQRVKADDVLSVMEYGVQEVTVGVAALRAEAKAAVRSRELQLEEANILLERTTEAFQKGAAQEWEVRQRKLQRDGAQAQLDEAVESQELAKKNLELEQEKLKLYKLRAPFDARIISVFVEAGATMTQQDKLVGLAALDELEAQIHLPVELYRLLVSRIGQDFKLYAEEPVNRELTGKLKYIQPIIDSSSGSVRCVFTIDNKDESMPAGFNVKFVDGDKLLKLANEQRAAAAK